MTFGASSYSIKRDEKQIQMELMNNGPVEAAFTVFDDFPNYKSGKYLRSSVVHGIMFLVTSISKILEL